MNADEREPFDDDFAEYTFERRYGALSQHGQLDFRESPSGVHADVSRRALTTRFCVRVAEEAERFGVAELSNPRNAEGPKQGIEFVHAAVAAVLAFGTAEPRNVSTLASLQSEVARIAVNSSEQPTVAAGTDSEISAENHNLSAAGFELFCEWAKQYKESNGEASRRDFLREKLKKPVADRIGKWLGKTRLYDDRGRPLSNAVLLQRRVAAFEAEFKRSGEYCKRVIARIDDEIAKGAGT